jgi:hypothetical protein
MCWRAILGRNRLALIMMLSMAMVASGNVRIAGAQGVIVTPPRDLKKIDNAVFRRDLPPIPADSSPNPAKVVAPEVEFASVEIRTELPAVPGARLALDVDRGAIEGTTFRWVQSEGPAVAIEDPTRPSIQITIPPGTDRLGFILVAARPERVKVVRVSVPVQSNSRSSEGSSEGSPTRLSWGSSPSGKVKANAGDDQVGLVGHRVTLNGSQSVPSDGKGARWVQLGGPAILGPERQGLFFSFVPSGPGLYRFLLMVAGDGELSDPDEVSVLVGMPPAGTNPPAVAPPVAMASQPPATPPPLTPEQILASNLARIADGPRLASEIADVLESVSERATLYPSFDYLLSELSRRLDVVIPSNPSLRAEWNQGVFAPLTAYTASQLLTAGINLSQPEGLRQPLNASQRGQVRDHYQKVARAFRTASAKR